MIGNIEILIDSNILLGSTIHALASELGLEIYYVQLASQGYDVPCPRRVLSHI